MFDSFKALGQLGPMLAQAKQMQSKMAEIQKKLPTLRASGSAGGGMVTATASGTMEIVDLQIHADAAKEDGELLADMIRAAVNQALVNVRDLMQREMQGLTGDMDLSAMQHLLGGQGS